MARVTTYAVPGGRQVNQIGENQAEMQRLLAEAKAAVATLNAMVASISPRADRLLTLVDSTAKEVLWVPLDCSLNSAITGDIDAAIAALKARPSPIHISDRSEWLEVLTDRTKMLLRGVDVYGDMWTQGYNVTDFFRSGGISAAMQAALYPTADVTAYGDSITENWANFSVDMAAGFAAAGDTKIRTYTARGLGGQSGAQILARQGGRPEQLTFPLGGSGVWEIPASGTCTVTVATGALNHPGDGNVHEKTMAGIVQIGGGVAGTLRRLAGGTSYEFTRSVAGSVIKVPKQVAIYPDNAAERKKISFCYVGVNDMLAGASAATIIQIITDYVEAQSTITKRGVIWVPHFNQALTGAALTAARATFDAVYVGLQARYGTRVRHTIDFMSRLALDANDLSDVAAGKMPRSLFAVEDGGATLVHYLTARAPITAYQAIANETGLMAVGGGW